MEEYRVMEPAAFRLADALKQLTATPGILNAWLRPLPAEWTSGNEGGDSWSAFDVVEASRGKSMSDLLDNFATIRAASVAALSEHQLGERDLDRRGLHPALGTVTARQLLATWVAHDLDHLMQIARVLAFRYRHDVGPWRAYLRVISGTQG
jgi:hypothetical protein